MPLTHHLTSSSSELIHRIGIPYSSMRRGAGVKLSPEKADSRLDLPDAPEPMEADTPIIEGAFEGVRLPEIPDREILDERAPVLNSDCHEEMINIK